MEIKKCTVTIGDHVRLHFSHYGKEYITEGKWVQNTPNGVMVGMQFFNNANILSIFRININNNINSGANHG